MSVSQATGDLFNPKGWTIHAQYDEPVEWPVDAIGHGVNCRGAMGSGIAVEFRNRFPVMHRDYVEMCARGWLLPGQVFPWFENEEVPYVFNIASQYHPGPDAHLEYLEVGLIYCRFYMQQHNLHHLALPRIGAGIGGLKWEHVVHVVEDLFSDNEDIHVTLVSLEGA